jgi:hypothetical protein
VICTEAVSKTLLHTFVPGMALGSKMIAVERGCEAARERGVVGRMGGETNVAWVSCQLATVLEWWSIDFWGCGGDKAVGARGESRNSSFLKYASNSIRWR